MADGNSVIDKAHSTSLEIKTPVTIRAFDHYRYESQVGSREGDASCQLVE